MIIIIILSSLHCSMHSSLSLTLPTYVLLPYNLHIELKFNTVDVVELKRAVCERYEHQYWPNVQKKSIIDEKIRLKMWLI